MSRLPDMYKLVTVRLGSESRNRQKLKKDVKRKSKSRKFIF